uniref:RING-type E3 ubiquitin transferase n=2 Tax=Leptobrachium leishanense TaxID=445787 RepID=A0A8C5P7T9_9ANUR
MTLFFLVMFYALTGLLLLAVAAPPKIRMGQEACKSAWPKPAGGYQTITGRRYGRRHAYVSFRPSLESPKRTSSQCGDCEGLELGDVQKENDLTSIEDCDSSLHSLGGGLNSTFKENRRSDVNDSVSVLSEARRNRASHFSMSEDAWDCHSLSKDDCVSSAKIHIMHAPVEHLQHSHQNGISFVNIDSFEPESSEEEENICFSGDFSLAREKEKPQKDLYGMLSELEKACLDKTLSGTSATTNNLSQACLVSLEKCRTADIGPDLTRNSTPADEATAIKIPDACEVQKKNNKLSIAAINTVANTQSDQGNELVVRPKIRKPVSSVPCAKMNALNVESEGKATSSVKQGNRDMCDSAERICMEEKEPCDAEFDPVYFDSTSNHIRTSNKDLGQDKSDVDEAFWDDFKFYGLSLTGSNKDEDSSVCSDGEWSTCLPSYFSTDKEQSSSDESWETLPGKDEQEVQSNSSSLEEENSDFCFQVEEQNSLEDGEIPWPRYHEDIESSTDEDNEVGSHFVHPGFFMLDGNNNLEDDSSMSEDLEVEWRLLDDFGDGLGVAQAMSYVDPQFLTYMALEERLAQAMETALAHLESLAVDIEQAHPPATKESIECLPQIIITDDHNVVGQEQCCAICCSEYIKDEILTELPCHHLFHKPCVTLWLQKSGTCPVCRHVLASMLPEAAATSFLSEHESPPSIHSAAGTR